MKSEGPWYFQVIGRKKTSNPLTPELLNDGLSSSIEMQCDLIVGRNHAIDTRYTSQHLVFGASFSVGVDSETEAVPFSVVENTNIAFDWKWVVL